MAAAERLQRGFIMITIGVEGYRTVAILLGIALLLSFYALHRARLYGHRLQEKYFKLAGAANIYIFEYDIRKDILHLSQPCAELFGLDLHIEHYMEQARRLEDHRLERASAYFDAAMALQDTAAQVKIPLADNSLGVFQVNNEFIYDRHNRLESIIGLFADVTRDFHQKEKLAAKAQVDALTKVYNSGTVRRMLTEAMDGAANGQAALLILDVDHFKAVNDSLGHQAGDKALQLVARSLKAVLRCTDIIGRLGGDEFCVYLADIPSYEFVCEICGHINAAVTEGIRQENIAMNITVSIGGTVLRPTDDFEAAYARADVSLYEAKKLGRNTFVVGK